ncbi:MAG: hypothetical protein KA184_14700 [Candidatus Hydrogenedentes bacterium]|nr:hypothetical protein [Candidatus Hydrogenedentota bacterium]
MSDVPPPRNWLSFNLEKAVACLIQDWIPILLATLALGLLGAVAGKTTNSVASTAYLVLSPLPLRTGTTEMDELAQMIAEPLDPTTLSLLCVSDEVLQSTLDAYNARVEEYNADENGEYGPDTMEDLWSLHNALQYEITIAKETPYETIQSPILKLLAKGSSAAQAKLLVDVWAEECVKAAQRYQTTRHGPSVEAFVQQTQEQLDKLTTVDQRVRDFWTNNNPELLQEQLNLMISLSRNYQDSIWETEQEIMQEEARVASLQTALQQVESTIKLRWEPPQRLLQMLGGGLASGLVPVAPEAAGPEAAKPEALLMEQENPVYTRLATEVAISEATVAGGEAKLKKLGELLKQIDEERVRLQQQSAATKLELEKIVRDSEIATAAYKSAAEKLEFARIAQTLQQPELQLLSKGAEWPLPRFRRAILFGAFAAFVGLLGSAFLSVAYRLILRPFLEAAS